MTIYPQTYFVHFNRCKSVSAECVCLLFFAPFSRRQSEWSLRWEFICYALFDGVFYKSMQFIAKPMRFCDIVSLHILLCCLWNRQKRREDGRSTAPAISSVLVSSQNSFKLTLSPFYRDVWITFKRRTYNCDGIIICLYFF